MYRGRGKVAKLEQNMSRRETDRDVATGSGVISVYTLPKSGQVNFLCSNNDLRTVIELLIPQ